jgi:hypothetical protein
MSALDNTPQNRNFLSPLNFKFAIKRAPSTNFFIQSVSMPGIRLPSMDIPNQFIAIPTPVTHMEYEDLEIEFKVDEDFHNYLELHNWIRGLGFPEQYEEYANIAKNPEYTGEGLVSDLSLIVLNSAKNPNYEFVFRNSFPTSLSGFRLSSVEDGVNYVTARASFKFLLFDITKI